MLIECTRFIDASEPDANGDYSYYYEYDLYRFTVADLCLVARSYAGDMQGVSFLSIERQGKSYNLTDADLTHPLFFAARAHLYGLGKLRQIWLSGRWNGYEALPLNLRNGVGASDR